MKKRRENALYWPYIGLLFPLMFSACADDETALRIDDNSGKTVIEMCASIDQNNESRADESGFADGDRMGVFIVSYNGNNPGNLTAHSNLANNVALTYDAENCKWISVLELYWPDETTPVDVYGYYPFDNAVSSMDAYTFEVAKDQSLKEEDGEMGSYEASDFLWAKAEKAVPGKTVTLSYHHMMAGVKVVLQQGTGFVGDEFHKLTKSVTVDNTRRTASVDLSTGLATAIGAPDYNVVMNNDDNCYRAIVVPQVVEDGKSTIGITLDGTNYAYTRNGGMKYNAGKLHTFTLKIDKSESSGKYTVTFASEAISDWVADSSSHDFEANSYVLVHCPEPGKLKEALSANGIDYLTVKNLKVTGQLGMEDTQLMRSEMKSLASLNLKEATFPHSLVYMVWNNGYTEFYADDAIPAGAFQDNKTIRRFVLPETIKEIGANAFGGTEATSAIVIPESVVKIHGSAFSYIWDKTEIVLPSKLEYIGEGAFYTAAKIELRLPSTLKYIGDQAFSHAGNVYGTFSIPSSLEYLGSNAFHGTGHDLMGDVVIPPGLLTNIQFEVNFANGTNITLPEGLKRIDRLAGKFNSPVILPQGLEYIGSQAFYDTKFSSPIVFPESVVYIGPGAFLVSNLPGRVEIPPLVDCVKSGSFNCTAITEAIIGDQVLMIEREAFGSNSSLRYVEIGKNMEYIGQGAFGDCVNIQTIVVMAQEPPKASDAFNGCDAERTVLEVPPGCVDVYRNAAGWNTFRNITEHRELAVDLAEVECLEKGVAREAIVRAEGAWRVTKCPSWVHVSPMESTAKDNIEIKVDPSAEPRAGVIEFTLLGKDYTTEVKVSQLKYEHPEDQEIVLQRASVGTGVPIMIVGEGFPASRIADGTYMRIMNETMEQFFDIEPYRSLRDHFTVITAPACSAEDGISDYYTDRQTKFSMQYDLTPNLDKARAYAEAVSPGVMKGNMSNALMIIVANADIFGGWTNIDRDGFSVASVGHVNGAVYPYDQRGLVQHYAGGMAFAGLGEEHVSHFENIKSCKCGGCNGLSQFYEMKQRGYYANLSISGKMNEAPWRDFIFHPKYSADVDMWEGGHRHLRGVWRSESQSVMGTYIRYFNAISRYTIYQGVKRRAGLEYSLNDFIANDKRDIIQ